MNRNSNDSTSTKTLQPMHWVLIVCGMIVLLTAAVLYNQHQQRQTDLKLAQLGSDTIPSISFKFIYNN